MLQIILSFIDLMRDAVVVHRIPVYRVMELPVLEDIHRMKYTYKGDDPAPFEAVLDRLQEEFSALLEKETLDAKTVQMEEDNWVL
jgi:hypothetical protein